MMNNKCSSEVLEACLNLVFTGQETVGSALARHPEYAERLRPELEAALWLHRRRKVSDVRPGYVAASRQYLVNQIKQGNHNSVLGKKPIFAWRPTVFRLAFVALFLVISAFAYYGGSSAVNASLPGDRLYNLKLAVEDGQLSMASNSVTEVELRIALAERRVIEVESLLVQDRYEDAKVALVAYHGHLSIAGDLIAELQNDPEVQISLAEKLASTITRNNERFATMMAASNIPGEMVAVLSITLSLNDELAFTMVMLFDDDGNEFFPAEWTETPTSTSTSTLTATSTSTLTSTPTSTLTATSTPTFTLEPSETPGPSETPTPVPSVTPRPTDNDDGGDDDDREPVPTRKPTNTPKPKKPTKTPKDKD
jgi:hypothetical protein